jgi:hypothetical protein
MRILAVYGNSGAGKPFGSPWRGATGSGSDPAVLHSRPHYQTTLLGECTSVVRLPDEVAGLKKMDGGRFPQLIAFDLEYVSH